MGLYPQYYSHLYLSFFNTTFNNLQLYRNNVIGGGKWIT